MLERLTIKNFQKHRKVVIEFDPGITTLVGESDVGKSSVLRALRWLAFNRPSGTAFIRAGEEEAKVRLRVDGSAITRHRGRGSANTFQVDGRTFRAFATDVPEAVRDLLNLGEVNFQQQHDPPFWLTLSPGEVSRELNQIVNLGSIDASLSSIASELRKARATVEVSEGRLKEAKEREETLRWTVEAAEELAIIEEKEQKAGALRERAESLRSLLKEILVAKRSRTLYKRSSHEGEAILERGEKVLELQERAVRLRSLLNKTRETKDELCKTMKDAIELEDTLKDDLGETCPLCGGAINDICTGS